MTEISDSSRFKVPNKRLLEPFIPDNPKTKIETIPQNTPKEIQEKTYKKNIPEKTNTENGYSDEELKRIIDEIE